MPLFLAGFQKTRSSSLFVLTLSLLAALHGPSLAIKQEEELSRAGGFPSIENVLELRPQAPLGNYNNLFPEGVSAVHLDEHERVMSRKARSKARRKAEKEKEEREKGTEKERETKKEEKEETEGVFKMQAVSPGGTVQGNPMKLPRNEDEFWDEEFELGEGTGRDEKAPTMMGNYLREVVQGKLLSAQDLRPLLDSGLMHEKANEALIGKVPPAPFPFKFIPTSLKKLLTIASSGPAGAGFVQYLNHEQAYPVALDLDMYGPVGRDDVSEHAAGAAKSPIGLLFNDRRWAFSDETARSFREDAEMQAALELPIVVHMGSPGNKALNPTDAKRLEVLHYGAGDKDFWTDKNPSGWRLLVKADCCEGATATTAAGADFGALKAALQSSNAVYEHFRNK